MYLFLAPTIGFDLLYVLVIVRLERRKLVWINVTPHPTAEWIARQVTEAFPWAEAPRYLIRDRDRVYGAAVTHRLRAMGIRDKPIAPGSPWQNGFAERLIGSIRRECVDHIVVLGEAHLRRILTKYAAYYNELRTHRSLGKDAPIHRAIQHVGRIAVSSADFIIIIAESNFRYRQLHEQPDNGKGHAGSNARINVQCSEFVMQLARSVRRACSERGGGSRVQDERRCPRLCLNADSDALHYRRLGRRRMSPALAMLSVPQVPRILHARAASAGATRHHTLLKGSEGAAPATAAGVNHAPWPIDFGGGRASIHHNASCERKQGESGADQGHGYPPNMGAARRSNTQQDPLFQSQ